jgi:hypothetical protein
MAQITRLHDLYSFPDFTPAAHVQGVFGDPYAVLISLRRRLKKRSVESVAPFIAPFTIKHSAASATSIAVDDASTSGPAFAESHAGSVVL